MKPDSKTVKFRNVSVTIFPWHPRPGVTYWKFRKGRAHVCRAKFEDAKAEAAVYAQETYFGAAKIGLLSDDQTRAVRRLLDHDVRLSSVEDFLAWKATRHPVKQLADARREFLVAKLSSQGRSHHHLEILRKHLSRLPDVPLADYTVATFPALSGAARTRKNVILVWQQFFRWCRKMEWLPYDQPTAADRLEIPATPRKLPATWSPTELSTLVCNVSESYLPWLCLAAWAGIRTEEIAPDSKSEKDALQWSDIHLDRRIIIIRPEVAKTGHKRTIPICDALAAVLTPLAGTGRVCPALPPHTPRCGGDPAETTRLGKLVGGWKRNALRHSFISYRAAQVGLGQTSMEAGNSEAEAKASYLDAMTAAEADAWFTLSPDMVKLIHHKYTIRGISPMNLLPKKPGKSRVSRKKLA